MSAVAHAHTGADQTDLPYVLRAAVKLGLLESAAVLVIGLVSRMLDGSLEQALLVVLFVPATLMVIFLPGIWTRARSIEGIAGAAGIGLAATVVFLLVDVALFQPFGLYTHRWRDIGGGSNWWYHPVWWMVGTALPWLGAWSLACRASRGTEPSLVSLSIPVVIASAVVMVVAVLAGFPGAGWNAGTFGVAFLPGLVVATMIAVLGARRK